MSNPKPIPGALRLAGGGPPFFRLWTAAILIVGIGSLLPASGLHQIHYDDLNLNDKLVHFVNYSVLALLSMAASRFTKPGFFYAACMIPFGGALELLQKLVPGRTCELGDFIADSLGVVAGVLLALVWKAALSRWASDYCV